MRWDLRAIEVLPVNSISLAGTEPFIFARADRVSLGFLLP